MVAESLEREVVTAADDEVPAIQQLENLLDRLQAERRHLGSIGRPKPRARLIGADGDELEIPTAIYQLLCKIVPLLLEGDSIAIMPIHKELTTQQAADFLNMSRQYLVTLLERGEIPFSKTGSHRRILFRDLLAYSNRRRIERKAGLATLTRLAEESGEYT
jgi:excisionase family DNA binding protein